jgi:galactosylceramidase
LLLERTMRAASKARQFAVAAALVAGAASAGAASPIPLNLSDVGVRYWGVGALSAGASTRLLADYPPEIIEDVYDALFKPNAGGAMQVLKVEIGCVLRGMCAL